MASPAKRSHAFVPKSDLQIMTFLAVKS